MEIKIGDTLTIPSGWDIGNNSVTIITQFSNEDALQKTILNVSKLEEYITTGNITLD